MPHQLEVTSLSVGEREGGGGGETVWTKPQESMELDDEITDLDRSMRHLQARSSPT